MNRSRHPQRSRLAIALLGIVVVAGCAGLPRIDPSGRRILIWPERSPLATAPALPQLGNGLLGNLDVPPVFSGQQAPPPTAVGVAPPPAVAPAPAAASPIAQAPRPAISGPAEEQLSITPERLLAPVGSEVVLKAGVCYERGYLRTNRRVEWMLGQAGVGQFVTVGEQGEMDILRLPWQRPNKFDNAYAVGYTSPFHTCLRRGTDDTSDDVQVRPGEAWITVSSPREGVSYVTASAPESDNWDARRATATIYWVDAQWRLPPPLSLQPGQTGALTTTVTRQTDGAPIAGWTVRYDVAGGGNAQLGYGAGATAQATTDASGRASIEVTPTDDQPGSTSVRVSIVRPATSGAMPSPQLELGGGETLVTWTPTATLVEPGAGPPATPPGRPTPPAPFEPPPRVDDPIAPPPRTLGPKLRVTLRRDTTGPIRVRDPIPVTVTLLNEGDEPAERVLLIDEYDRGLSNSRDTLGRYKVENPNVGDLAPGESVEVPLDFSAVSPGRHCHRVTVEADGMASVFEQQCFEIEPAPEAPKPSLRIETDLDRVREVGDTVTLLATVYNDGPGPAENVRLKVLSDPELFAEVASGDQFGIEGGVEWRIDRIAAGGRYKVTLVLRCQRAAESAQITSYAATLDGEFAERRDAVEILPAAVEPPPTPAAPLEGALSSTANPARVGQSAVLNLAISNTTNQSLSNVQFRVLIPRQITPTLSPDASPLRFRQRGAALEFQAIATLEPGVPFRLAIPFTATEQGVADVRLEVRLGGDGRAFPATESISIGPR